MASVDEVVEVAFPFTSTDPDQLQLALGESIVIIKKTSTGWWIGRDVRGNVGSFPVNYTRPVKEKPKFAVTKEFKTAQLTTPTTTQFVTAQGIHNTNGTVATASSSASTTPPPGADLLLSVSSSPAHPAVQHQRPLAGGSQVAGGPAQLHTSAHSGGFYRNMSRGDAQQLKDLLGFDDDDDDDFGGDASGDEEDAGTPHRNGGGSASKRHGGGSSSKKKKGNSPEHRRALETFLSSAFENTAGNHRSLNEGRPTQGGGGGIGLRGGGHPLMNGDGLEGSHSMRSMGSASSGWSPGAQLRNQRHASLTASSAQQLTDQVMTLRREIAKEKVNYEKLHVKESSMKRASDLDESALDELRARVASVKVDVQKHQATVADFEKRIEALRYVVEHPDEDHDNGHGASALYDPHRLANAIQELEHPLAAATTAATAVASTANDPSATKEVVEDNEEPSEELIEAEPHAKKLIRKLKKKIAEAEGTEEGYKKQLTKAKKRVSKFRESIKQLDEEITLLRHTLMLSGGEDKDDNLGANNNNNEVTSSAANSEDDEITASSAAGSPTAGVAASTRHESKKKRSTESREERIFRGIIATLTEEEQADIERYQLAELKLQQKSAKLREQLEGDSTEVATLRARIDKLKKLLIKGDQVMEELVHQRDDIQKQIHGIGASAEASAASFAAAQAAQAKASQALKEARRIRDEALAKRDRDRENLLLRIAKERQRVADFEAELVRLKEKAAVAAKS